MIYSHQAAEMIFIFSSNNELLNAEDALSEFGLSFRMIPTPKEVHSACGLALAFDEPDRRTEYLATLKQAGLQPGVIYLRQGRHFTVM